MALINAKTGTLYTATTFGGEEEDAGNDIFLSFFLNPDGYYEPVAFVTGSFADDVDFAPNQINFGDATSEGGKDIFVARYNSGNHLRWVWTNGTTGENRDDVGEGITVSSSLRDHVIFVAGWVDATQTPSDDDIWIARIDDEYSYPTVEVAWSHILPSTRAHAEDISLDAEGRVVVTGFFRDSVDFDPVGTDLRSSGGSYDAFLARFYPSGIYDGVDTFGGTAADVGRAVDCLQGDLSDMNGLYLHGGHFGGGAGSGYTVDFDPDPSGTANAVSYGAQDGFLNVLTFTPPEADTAIMLLLDASGSMAVEECSDGYTYWNAMIDAYQNILLDGDTIIPRDGSVALAAAVFEDAGDAKQVIPWVVIDSQDAAEAFSFSLDSIVPSGGFSFLSYGIDVALESFDLGLVSAEHNIINVAANGYDERDEDRIEQSGDLALGGQVVELIDAIAIETDDLDLRENLLIYLVGNNLNLVVAERMGCAALADGDYAICPPAEGISDFQAAQMKKFIYERYHHCYGDAAQDCELGQGDLGVILAYWGMTDADPNFPDYLDWSGDGLIGQEELGIVLANYGCTSN